MFGPHVCGGCLRTLPRVVIGGKPIHGPAWTSITSTDNKRGYQGGFFLVRVTVGHGEIPDQSLSARVHMNPSHRLEVGGPTYYAS
jgi:hypothetical protein